MSTEPLLTAPVGDHPIPERHSYAHDNRLLLTIIAVLAIALAVIGVVAFPQPTNNGVAKKKAAQLETLLRERGLPIPSSLKVLTNSLGTTGGAVCKGSGYNLTDAIFDQQLAAGGGVITARPLPVEKAVLNGQLATIDVYCPSRAAAFRKHFENYKLYGLTRE